VDERPDPSSALQHVLRLISFKRLAIRIFDANGHGVSLDKLRRFALADAGRPLVADSRSQNNSL
jgi:hypothetical protein